MFGGIVFDRTKIFKILIAVFGVFFVLVCLLCFFVFGKQIVGQKMTINYATNSKYVIKNCRRDGGYFQRLIGGHDNVKYCMDFPIFESKKQNAILFHEINNRIYCYRKEELDKDFLNDKFEFYSNYQTFKGAEDDDNVSVQFQFLERNLTKKTEMEFTKTFVFRGNEVIEAQKFFKREGVRKVVDLIRKNFSEKFANVLHKIKIDLNEILPYSLKTLQNFVITDKELIFFFDRGSVLPSKFKTVSVGVDLASVEDCTSFNARCKQDRLTEEEAKKPVVALTFDDGPSPNTTPEVLKILKENGAKATFFVIGDKARSHPEVLPKILEQGCEIGNHTLTHRSLKTLSQVEIKKEINTTNEIIEEATGGYKPSLVRPMGGIYNNKIANLINFPLILWQVDPKDWKTRNADQTIKIVLDNVKDGSIIIMHDVYESSVEAAKVIIPKLIERGFHLATVSEMFELKGESLNAHEVYFNAKTS